MSVFFKESRRNRLFSLALGLIAVLPITSEAGIISIGSAWTTNEGPSGNYLLTIRDGADGDDRNGDRNDWDWTLSVDPWNAEALGLFIDIGDSSVPDSFRGPYDIYTSPTLGVPISVFDTDTRKHSCGRGCNLNGLNPDLITPDNEWELVLRLGAQGSDGVQTWNFSTSRLGFLSDIAVVGIRAQNLCESGQLLPSKNCGGSDKSFQVVQVPDNPPSHGTPSSSSSSSPSSVPVPAPVGLIGLGGMLLGWVNRRQAAR